LKSLSNATKETKHSDAVSITITLETFNARKITYSFINAACVSTLEVARTTSNNRDNQTQVKPDLGPIEKHTFYTPTLYR